MAFGRIPRVDAKGLIPSFYSKWSLAVFVALCLAGVWMMVSLVILFRSAYISVEGAKSQVKEQLVKREPCQFEDGLGDIPREEMSSDWKGSNRGQTNSKANEEKTKGRVEADECNVDKDVPIFTSMMTRVGRDEKIDNGQTNAYGGQLTLGNKENNGGGRAVSLKAKEMNAEVGARNANEHLDTQEEKIEGEKKSKGIMGETMLAETRENLVRKRAHELEKNLTDKNRDDVNDQSLNEIDAGTQATKSKNEMEAPKSASSQDRASIMEDSFVYKWKLCNTIVGPDYIPCLDNLEAIKKIPDTSHYQHRERHCPKEAPTCLVPLPLGYKRPIEWPDSRDKIWFSNVPHTLLAKVKGRQNWLHVSGEYVTFPGGGTQFASGASHYIEFIQKSLSDIAWGIRIRVVLDIGCGVASFGGYLFEKYVLTMSFAPKDEHEAQVQFALERGIPAISAVMGTKRLPFSSQVFDLVHCARCRVPWHIEGGKLLLELNRVMRSGGFFVWSAPPIYRKDADSVEIWNAMSEITKSICWEVVAIKKNPLNRKSIVIYKKPSSNSCYEKRVESSPPLCGENDDPDATWNVPLQACIHRIPVASGDRGSHWPDLWPFRLEKVPYWLNSSHAGVYGKAAHEDFVTDYEHWKNIVRNLYLNGMGINWSMVRNVMDMRSIYGGFAAALKDMKVWVMNVVLIDSPDTLPIIYERGLFGVYHDWCESFSTYPRTYDLLHADHLFSKVKERCKSVSLMAEVDRILRPEGTLIARDQVDTIIEVESMAKSLHWDVCLSIFKNSEGLLCLRKTMWRPKEFDTTM